MANEINKKDQERLEEGYTEFGGTGARVPFGGSWFSPSGRLGRWFAKFFATKAQPYVADQGKLGDTPMHPLAGDTVVADDVIKPEGPARLSLNRVGMPHIPEVERNRKQRYKLFESMDEYPEIGAAFDIYADDGTQLDIRGNRWTVDTKEKNALDEIEELFSTIKLDRFYWDIFRNMVKYGDCFIELVLDMNNPKAGIQRIKILNPNFILRVENEYGYLTDFLQEIPEKPDWNTFGGQSSQMRGAQFITLDKNQLVHFRMHTSDPAFYPYGKAVGAIAHRIFRSLKLMEDAMLIYRLQRAPERRIFYVDIGNLPSHKAEAYIERLKEKFKKEKYFNQSTGGIDERYNPLSADEDFFVPIKGNQGTKIDTLPGAQNLGEVDDVKYFRDKLLAALKIPKDYIVEKDQSPERKANLSQLDVKFARTILRIQQCMEIGMEQVAKRHLQLKGFPNSLVHDLRIKLPDPSDMHAKRKLDIDEQVARVVQAVLGLGIFPKSKIYKDYFDLTDQEIDEIEKELEKQQKKEAEMQEDTMGPAGAPMGGPPMGGPPMAGPNMDQEAGGQEPNENIPPTQTAESVLSDLKSLRTKMLSEGQVRNWQPKAVDRLINRLGADK